MGRCTSLVGLQGGGRRGVIQCGIYCGSAAMEEEGGGMLISFVDAMTCNMGLIA